MSLPRYPEYKDSGVAWLGEVPAHWQTKRLRHVAGLNPSKNETVSLPRDTVVSFLPMEAIGEDGTITLEQTRLLSQVETGYTYFRDGDVAVAKITPCFENGKGAVMRGLLGGIGFGSTELIVSRPRPEHTNSNYLNWIFNSTQFRKLAEGAMYGAGGQKRVPDDFVRNFAMAFPPVAEQTKIATFLDRETAKIDGLIAEQEKLIALLAEKRQATISHAVTKGLNPDAPMKDSGVEGLGEVPTHWNIISLARLASEKCDGPFGSGIKSEHYKDDGALVVRLQNIRAEGFFDGEPAYLDLEYFQNELLRHAILPGDVLIAGLGDDRNLVGRACVAPENLGPALVKADCFRFRLITNLALADFIATQLSATAICDSGRLATGSTRSRIPLSIMASRKMAIPQIKEQADIVNFIKKENTKLDALTGEASRGIALLKERRSALISTAVTGRIDVRHSVWDTKGQRQDATI